jgi:CBS domain-containing protein
MESTLEGITARDVMRTDVDILDPTVTIEELVQDHVLKRNARCFAVLAGGEFAGLVTLTDVRKTPRDLWPSTSVYRAMTPATRLHTVSPDDKLTLVMQLMAQHDINQLPVLQGRSLAGMLTRADVLRFIKLRQDLGDVPAPSARQDAAEPDRQPAAGVTPPDLL